MRKKNYKGRCVKKSVEKSNEVCRTYDEIQLAYLDDLQRNQNVKEIRCNVPFDNSELGEYTTDFLCVKTNNDLMVRECIFQKLLARPKTAKLLDASRTYWTRRGVIDWGLVVDEEE
jgi:hypothetical protein